MKKFKIEKPITVEHSLFLKKIATYQWVNVKKAKLIRGDPPKIDLKETGRPLINNKTKFNNLSRFIRSLKRIISILI